MAEIGIDIGKSISIALEAKGPVRMIMSNSASNIKGLRFGLIVAVYRMNFPVPVIPSSNARHTMVEMDVRTSYFQHPVCKSLIPLINPYIGSRA